MPHPIKKSHVVLYFYHSNSNIRVHLTIGLEPSIEPVYMFRVFALFVKYNSLQHVWEFRCTLREGRPYDLR